MLIDQAGLHQPMAGQVAVVTGAGMGIGRETARALARLGASIAIAEIGDEAGRDSENAIREAGGKALYVHTDVSDPSAMQALSDQTTRSLGAVDIVINDAAALYPKALLDYSLDEWERVMAVNLRGAFLAAKLFLPGMLARKRGVFVTMESGDGMPFLAPYFASKVALRSLAMSIAQEVGTASGVSVFCYAPGMVDTPGIRAVLPQIAPLYGISESEFLKNSAPGGVLATAEESGTGLAGCVLHAAEFHGQEADPAAGMARLGISASTAPGAMPTEPEPARARAAVVHTTKAVPPVAPGTDPFADFQNLVKQLRAECDSLGVFQRQWWLRTLQHRSGLSLAEWEAESQKIGTGAGLTSEDAARYSEDLARLASHFQQMEADARGFIRDPVKLDAAESTLTSRAAIAQRASESLAEIARKQPVLAGTKTQG